MKQERYRKYSFPLCSIRELNILSINFLILYLNLSGFIFLPAIFVMPFSAKLINLIFWAWENIYGLESNHLFILTRLIDGVLSISLNPRNQCLYVSLFNLFIDSMAIITNGFQYLPDLYNKCIVNQYLPNIYS